MEDIISHNNFVAPPNHTHTHTTITTTTINNLEILVNKIWTQFIQKLAIFI